MSTSSKTAKSITVTDVAAAPAKPAAKAAPAKARQTARKPASKAQTKKATPTKGAAVAKPVEAAKPSKPSTKATFKADIYPLPEEELVLVAEAPKGLGSDQRKRWDELQAAVAALPKGEVLTAEYLAKTCEGGRRTVRRAKRAGLFANWNSGKDGGRTEA